MEQEDQLTMLQIKSLLNYLRYIVKDEDLHVLDEYHTVCRKYCSWGKPEKNKNNDN